MSYSIPYPVVNTNGIPTHVLVPMEDYMTFFARPDTPPAGYTFVPNDVARKVEENTNPLRAWREHFNLTQEEVALRMDISRPAYTQMEQSENPHLATLEKAAQAFGISPQQLIELYNDEPVSVPRHGQ